MFEEYLSIGEISKSTNIPISTLRYYDKIGLLSPAFKNSETKYRYYSHIQIAMIKIITYMRSMGFSIEYIKSHFDNMDYEHSLELFEKLIKNTQSEIKRLKGIEKELLEAKKEFKSNFEVEKKIGIPFLQEFEDINGVSYKGPINNHKELVKAIKAIDNFETSNNMNPILRGFKVSFDNFKKNRSCKEELIAVIKEDIYNNTLVIPKGKFACVYGKGIFEEQTLVEDLLKWIKENNLKPKDDFYLTFKDILMIKGKKDFLFLLRIPLK